MALLVVEDDREIAEMLELYLRHDGHKSERAADGEEARYLALLALTVPVTSVPPLCNYDQF